LPGKTEEDDMSEGEDDADGDGEEERVNEIAKLAEVNPVL
jgi:hypothetical protein